MIDTVNLSVEKMKRLLHKLSSGNFMEKPAPLLIEKLLQQAVEAKSGAEPKPMLEIKDSGLEVLANWSNLERVVGHLIQNAIEATPKNGSVLLRLARGGADAIIEIMDTGHGMSEQFIRERLFKPFESTKPAGMGIGVFECREYIQELGGRIEVESTPSTGTVFRIFIPTVTEGGAVEAFA
jgi:putative PEP-CTERM system histidine kinase